MADAGGGWLAHVEPGTGATYYAKGADVRWERPDEACQGVAQWQSRVDPATGVLKPRATRVRHCGIPREDGYR